MIILQKLAWDNCFSYGKDNEVNLADATLTQLVGTNGVGKSSIPLILEEVLFNKNSKNVKKADLKIKGLVLCSIGRIVNGKGLIDLVNAFAFFHKNHPDSSLLIIGGALHEENNLALKDFLDTAEKLNIKEKIPFLT